LTCAPACDPVVYLADYSRQVLLPLAPGVPAEQVAGTLAGRAFTSGEPVTSARDGHVRAWVPVTEQTARVGVLAVSFPDADPGHLAQAELLGTFAGLIVTGMSLVSDTPLIRRRGRSMSLPASMQWDLMPPWSTRVPGVLIAGILEPAYDIAGDAFDFAVDSHTVNFAIFDGMGHGINSTMLTGLVMGAYRHARRDAVPVPGIHIAIDEALASGYGDLSFATGILGSLSTATGRLGWTCAGHPRPLLLRGRKVVAELQCEATLPFGLGTGAPAMSSCDLEPGDMVLLYTDGVTEARADGELFGLGRLTDLVEREAASEQPPEELLRRLVRELLAYQGSGLRDDATLLLVQWTGPPL
jgi:serine/threonine protein phosphatase PrpC